MRFFSSTDFYQSLLSNFLLHLFSLLQWFFSSHHGKMFMSLKVLSSAYISLRVLLWMYMIFPNTDMRITSETLVMFPSASELFPPGCYTAVIPYIQTYFPWGLSPTHFFSYNVYFDDWEQSQSFKPKNHRNHSQLEYFLQLTPQTTMQILNLSILYPPFYCN